MKFRLTELKNRVTPGILARSLLALMLVGVLGACTSQAAREAEIAEQEAAARMAAEQEAARVAQEEEERRAIDEMRRREAMEAERARLAAEQERRDAEARALAEAEQRRRAEAEQRRREEAERRERARLEALAAAEAEREQRMARIDELEQQIAALQAQINTDEAASALYRGAITAAEELLRVLTAEQAKYENTDAEGNTVDPLAKDLIAELEARKDNLVRRARAQ